MRRMLQRLSLGIIAALGLCLLACERGERLPETGATLEGTVTYGKEKVQVALIIVQGPGSSANGFIGEDGRYKIDNVPLGEVNIGVNTEAGKGQLMSQRMAQSKGKASAPLPKVVDVPPKYFEPTNSGLKTTVKKGLNTHDIVIPK